MKTSASTGEGSGGNPTGDSTSPVYLDNQKVEANTRLPINPQIPIQKTLAGADTSSCPETPLRPVAFISDSSTDLQDTPYARFAPGDPAHQPPLRQHTDTMSYTVSRHLQYGDASTKEEPIAGEDMQVDHKTITHKESADPALGATEASLETLVNRSTSTHAQANRQEHPGEEQPSVEDSTEMAWSPALPIHALTCEDEGGEDVSMQEGDNEHSGSGGVIQMPGSST